MKTTRLYVTAAALALAGLAGSASAQIPSTAPYYTDPVNEYVADDTAQGIGNLNMVLCVIGALDMGDLVNAGPYIALIDMDKCQTSGGGNGNSAGATNFATATVNVTRTDNNSPMVGKVWISLTEGGGTTNVYAYLGATQSPTATNPYGLFRMDYIGKKTAGNVTSTGFNGFIDAQAGSISYFENGQQSSLTALAMAATSTTSGAGVMSVGQNGGGGGGTPTTFQFAYDATNFRRSDGTTDQCFDRSKANAARSVWRYGTYSATTGDRVDMANPGFPIQATYNSVSYYGFANYWGINFQGLDLNSVGDASPITGLTVSDQRQGNTTAYHLNKVGGKLTKWAQNATTLAALDGIPFTFGANLSGNTVGGLVSGWGNWVAHWDGLSGTFIVTGQQVCGPNGCLESALPNAVSQDTLSAAFADSTPISGWSNSFGGNLNIPVTGSAHASGDAVFYFTQSTVIPGSAGAPPALYCLSQCPTLTALQAFEASGAPSGTSPFGNSTAQQFFSAPAANTVSYVFGSTGLTESSSAMVVEQASQYPSGSPFAQNGIMTGRLFDTALSAGNCPGAMNVPQGTVCEPANPTVYYTWQTGTNQWSQSLWLTKASDGSVVALDPPVNVPYTVVTQDTTDANWLGKHILLQFNGFGNLWGVPGYCVSPVDNSTVDCSVQGSRYVSLFSIHDGALMTLPPSTPLIVKALNAELRLANLGANAAQCASMSLNSGLTLPTTAGLHDPTSSTDSEFLGTEPTVTGAPKVIDGVLQ